MINQIRKHLLSDKITRPNWHDKNTNRDFKKICLDKNENNDPNLKKIYKKIYSKYYQNSISHYPNLHDCYKAIAKLNKVSINPKFSVVDFSKTKNKTAKIKKL